MGSYQVFSTEECWIVTVNSQLIGTQTLVGMQVNPHPLDNLTPKDKIKDLVNWVSIKTMEGLVLVSFMCYHTSTSSLSTSWSTTPLIGRTSFQGSFPLRCFQRLSRPILATRRCSWRNNRYTRGSFTPVLSY